MKGAKLERAFLACVLINGYLQQYPVGHSLHVILSDKNYGKRTALFCADYAKKENDNLGFVIATLLSKFSESQQQRIVETPNEIIEAYLEQCAQP